MFPKNQKLSTMLYQLSRNMILLQAQMGFFLKIFLIYSCRISVYKVAGNLGNKLS